MGITPVDIGGATTQDGRMRENDDDAPATGPEGSLADGVGETMDQGDNASSGDPYGDVDFDDTYDDDTDATSDSDGSFGDDTSDDEG